MVTQGVSIEYKKYSHVIRFQRGINKLLNILVLPYRMFQNYKLYSKLLQHYKESVA